jgi:hypothetical protein
MNKNFPGKIVELLTGAEFIGKIRLLGVKLPTFISATSAFLKI